MDENETTESGSSVVAHLAVDLAKDVVVTAAGVVVAFGLLGVTTKAFTKIQNWRLAKSVDSPIVDES